MGYYRVFWSLNWQLFYCVVFKWVVASGQIRYSIPEELQLGAFVGNIADDLGLRTKELTARNFQIVPGSRKQYLDVNLDNGIMFVKQRIDREQLCGTSLTCTLSLEAVVENPLTVYRIEVEIQDVNDNAPTFPNSQIRLKISELAAPGARFPLEGARDSDVGTNSLQTFQLTANEYFSLDIDSRGGVGKLPELVLGRSLDREKQATYKLGLLAKDGGIPAKTGTAEIIIVVQDENDNAPGFQNSVYRVSIRENVPKGTLVIKLNATDLDDGSNGDILYLFSTHASVRVRESFYVHSKTGEIRVNGNLDYEEESIFEINIQAMDQGTNPSAGYCRVLVNIIDVNDNAPEVKLTSLFSPVREDSPPATVVALIGVWDADSGENGQVVCEIAARLPFTLDSSLRNYYRLLTHQRLDRENTSSYDIPIVCSDSGSPPLSSRKTITVEVSDINDNPPHFTQSTYTAYVMENNVIGAPIITVMAVDADLSQNSQLFYSVLESQALGEAVSIYVRVNPQNGDIFAQRTFDYEQLKNFQIQVQAKDSGEPPHTATTLVDVVILDQNDNAPVIVHPDTEYGSTASETISRSADPGYLVTKITATDADSGQNARLSYQILQATDLGLFTISPDTGEIWTIRNFARKDANKQRLIVVVNDNGTPTLSATMTLILSVAEDNIEILSRVNNLTEDADDLSFYLVIALGIISSTFLLILIGLAITVYKNRNGFGGYTCSLDTCCCFSTRSSLNSFQRGRRNIQIPPNYVEVFGGDPLSQRYRYGTTSSKGDCLYSNGCSSSTVRNGGRGEFVRNNEQPQSSQSNIYSNIGEVKQPNADWHFSQAHRAELNSSQYLEEEGARREIQCEVQREVQRDVQREPLRDEPCEAPRNIQRDVPRDSHCDGQRAAENDPGGPRKPMCARPPAIPAGRDGWTLPRTAPRMQLQMTLGAHVPGTLRSQYLFPRDPLTPGARISNSSVEFSAFPVGSHHGPWAANQTRDCGSVADSGTRRPELDTETGGEIHRSPPSSRLPTQRLHSRDHHHALRQIND
ncbi:protocadherin beta-7-like isoform X8 [Amblyraja radiata]|uniref:protocadherin beta-7-like isoform X8 n=1 Tax=Amblyraja radiata TaxID=386614 RepID=UPI001403DD56|nr:protocadherin beta-7-like isoform X8 [Amblyraja radiata]